MKAGILRNEEVDSGKKWELACRKANIDYEVIDITSHTWLDTIQQGCFDFLLLRPSGTFSYLKNLYDERLYIVTKVLQYRTYPSYEETILYENKRILSYFLEAAKIPHPKTWVFYHKREALHFILQCDYPLVAKTTIGASGSGVTVIRTEQQAKKYITKAFSRKGIKRTAGPNKATGSPASWLKKAVKSPSFFMKRLKRYIMIHKYGEKDFVILQEYIPHDYEWRMVKIGDAYFGHQKIKQGDMASGTKGINYVSPPEKLLDFTKELCDKHHFQFMAIDLFEDGKGGFLVNELQTIFGHVQDYILAVDGRPGRYRYVNNQWAFEAGDFNSNESFDLRLEVAVELFKKSKK